MYSILLNKNKNKVSTNLDSNLKLELLSNNEEFNLENINSVLDLSNQFYIERQSNKQYRIIGNINALFSNVLFNITGNNSMSSFMGTYFRDNSYPSNGISSNDKEDLSFRDSIYKNLTENDGWYGYYEKNKNLISPCKFIDLEPNRGLFSFNSKNLDKNWYITITYPHSKVNDNLTNGGLLVTTINKVVINKETLFCFGTPLKHNLSIGDQIEISGISPIVLNGKYDVVGLGFDNTLLDYYFLLKLEVSNVFLTANSRFSKIINDVKSEYYIRKFKKIKMVSGALVSNNDYEIYPLAFSNNIFNDKISQFIFNENIDITDLVDNLNRPLSEIYVTIIKANNSGFSNVKSGFDLKNIGTDNLSDIRRITNLNNLELDSNVTISDDYFLGDVVEYNKNELVETTLCNINHRFNTTNRDNGGTIVDPIDNSVLNLGNRYEGYYYNPHNKIQIREFSSYIETGDLNTLGLPDYYEVLSDGRVIWRDLLDIGFNDLKQVKIDYPFLNGCHYLNKNINFFLRRQDPFNDYNLFYKDFPNDKIGKTNNFNLNI